MRWLILLSLSVLMASCTARSGGYYTQSVNSWRGANLNALTAHWGKPNTSFTAGSGKTAYVYTREATIRTNTTYSPSIGFAGQNHAVPVVTTLPNVNTRTNQDLTATCITTFTTNAQNIIINTDIQGTYCDSDSNLAKALAKPGNRQAN